MDVLVEVIRHVSPREQPSIWTGHRATEPRISRTPRRNWRVHARSDALFQYGVYGICDPLSKTAARLRTEPNRREVRFLAAEGSPDKAVLAERCIERRRVGITQANQNVPHFG